MNTFIDILLAVILPIAVIFGTASLAEVVLYHFSPAIRELLDADKEEHDEH